MLVSRAIVMSCHLSLFFPCRTGSRKRILPDWKNSIKKSSIPADLSARDERYYYLTRYHSYLWTMSYTHGIRNLRISGILISSPYNGGNRLHLLLYNFRQLLKGEFHNFLPLLLSNQQFSVLRSGCTIPYHCILLITLFGFFEMKWTYVWIIHCKYTTNDLTICQSGQQDLNLRPHGPQPCALPSYAIPRNAS